MKILQIINSYPGETFLYEHAKALLEHTSLKIAWAYWQASSPGNVRRKPLHGLDECINLVNPNRLSKFDKATIRLFSFGRKYEDILKKQIKDIKPDLIHFHFSTLAIKHHKIALELGLPFTFSVRGSDIHSAPFSNTSYLSALTETASLSSGIHCVSDNLRELFLTNLSCEIEEVEEKISVIRTAIDKKWSRIERKPVRGQFISIGRLHWVKGYPDLILACRHLKDKNFPFNLTIIGEGDQRPYLEFLIKDLELLDCVKLVGRKSHEEIGSYFETAGLLLLTSWAEGFPNILGEAMIAGLPFLSYDTGSFKGILPSLITERVTPIADYLQLANRIMSRRIQNNDQLTAEAKEFALWAFSPDRHAKKFEQFWRKGLSF